MGKANTIRFWIELGSRFEFGAKNWFSKLVKIRFWIDLGAIWAPDSNSARKTVFENLSKSSFGLIWGAMWAPDLSSARIPVFENFSKSGFGMILEGFGLQIRNLREKLFLKICQNKVMD